MKMEFIRGNVSSNYLKFFTITIFSLLTSLQVYADNLSIIGHGEAVLIDRSKDGSIDEGNYTPSFLSSRDTPELLEKGFVVFGHQPELIAKKINVAELEFTITNTTQNSSPIHIYAYKKLIGEEITYPMHSLPPSWKIGEIDPANLGLGRHKIQVSAGLFQFMNAEPNNVIFQFGSRENNEGSQIGTSAQNMPITLHISYSSSESRSSSGLATAYDTRIFDESGNILQEYDGVFDFLQESFSQTHFNNDESNPSYSVGLMNFDLTDIQADTLKNVYLYTRLHSFGSLPKELRITAFKGEQALGLNDAVKPGVEVAKVSPDFIESEITKIPLDFSALKEVIGAYVTLRMEVDKIDTSTITLYGADPSTAQKLEFIISNRPTIDVLSPQGEVEKLSNESVTLTATAFDQEDGDLTELILWKSSLQGDLGQGSDITTQLDSGTHTISASVVDSDGEVSKKSIQILVTEAPAYADLAIEMNENGSDYDYLIQLSNNGPDLAENIIVTLNIPSGVTVESISHSQLCTLSHPLRCQFPVLASGKSENINITVSVKNITKEYQVIGEITSDAIDPDLSNNSTAKTFGSISLVFLSILGLLLLLRLAINRAEN